MTPFTPVLAFKRPIRRWVGLSVAVLLTLASGLVSGAPDIGILRRLVGVHHHRASDGVEELRAVQDITVVVRRIGAG